MPEEASAVCGSDLWVQCLATLETEMVSGPKILLILALQAALAL